MQDWTNVKDYVNQSWLTAMIASSVDVVRNNIVCATLQCGVWHPSEATYRELVGLLLWLTSDPQRNPTAHETHAELKRMKMLLASERVRMPPSALPPYVAMPGAAQIYQKHRAAYDLAWGADS